MKQLNEERIIYQYPGGGSGIDVCGLPADDEPTLLLGVNGAGKTTLLRLLAGELRPQRGELRTVQSTVYVPQKFVPIRGFAVEDYVAYVAWLHGRGRREAARDARGWVRFVGLDPVLDRECRKLSGGQQAKLQLAAGLNAGAERLLLDEPSASLDPLAKEELQRLYIKIVGDGIGLWVSTHQPHEVAEPFTRVIVIDGGRAVFIGGLDEFRLQANKADAPPIVASLARSTRGHL